MSEMVSKCKANGYRPTPSSSQRHVMYSEISSTFLFSLDFNFREVSNHKLLSRENNKPSFVLSNTQKSQQWHGKRLFELILSFIRIIDTTVGDNVSCFFLRAICLRISRLHKMTQESEDSGNFRRKETIPGESTTLATRSSPRPFRSKSLVVDA